MCGFSDALPCSEFGSLAEEIVDLLPVMPEPWRDVKSMIEPSASPRSRSQVATAIFSSRMTLGSRGVLRRCSLFLPRVQTNTTLRTSLMVNEAISDARRAWP